ncbi:Hpt domain-containing protein [Kordia sp. YSTF-M3]|uniref:Hpt domain-containing protein n=1 Tax=Kordia aestuariivivens TaxID=2759037 RepID=A0ABR7QG17_9FLAO|nr:Hpt domain-containing protein [Kordia aestuariivivens]MBC8757496.1 Hpt domain-containing protein [Kordia aestuariivivens]
MGYNLEKINAISDGDTDFIEAVVVAFIEEIPEDLVKFEHEVKSENYKEIYQVSHKIKPNLDLLGMQESYDINLQILSWSKAETNISDIATAFDSILAKINSNINELKKEFNL